MSVARSPGLPAVLLLSLPLWTGCEGEPPDPDRFPVIPHPDRMEPLEGTFVLGEETTIQLPSSADAELQETVHRWATELRDETGLPLPVVKGDEAGGGIRVEAPEGPESGLEPPPTGWSPPGIQAETYRLRIDPGGVEVSATANAGVFYGLMTLRQLLRKPDAGGPWQLPSVRVRDRPRFTYRGMHLDVGRHHFPVEFIKRYIDLLASYKMNVFHWHLTEDQGWRLEIRRYPRLTEVGSCRAETILEKHFDPYLGDGVEYCGFYTQDQVREIVEYARARFVTVMPEIEMPGHSVAALAAYPELACSPGPFQVSTRWGITRDIYCPKEETFQFLEDVLTEVMDLFPSRFIHIGGDEAPKTAWEQSEVAQEIIRREGLDGEEELQSWFIRRIERFLNENGRRLVGWDEILEGGLAPNATVMSWRGMRGGIEAARQGHDVIMTPTGWAYFDYYQGDTLPEPLAIGGYTPLEKVYGFEPVPRELSREEGRRVLGAQGNVWTEYMASSSHVEYMVLPRMLAMAEVVWSPRRRRSWKTFMGRLPSHLNRLARQGINFRPPGALRLPDPGVPGDPPRPKEGGSLAEGGGSFLPPVALPYAARNPGLRLRAVAGPFESVDALVTDGSSVPPEGASAETASHLAETAFHPAAATADPPRTMPGILLPEGARGNDFGLVFSGHIRAPRKGVYTFYLSSDDGSRLSIGEKVVVDHDGIHTMTSRSGRVALHRGWHPLELRYFQARGRRGLRLEMEGPGVERGRIRADWLAHRKSDLSESGNGG